MLASPGVCLEIIWKSLNLTWPSFFSASRAEGGHSGLFLSVHLEASLCRLEWHSTLGSCAQELVHTLWRKTWPSGFEPVSCLSLKDNTIWVDPASSEEGEKWESGLISRSQEWRGDAPGCKPCNYCFFPRCQAAQVYFMDKAIEELIYIYLESLTQNTQMLSMEPCLRTCYILLCPSLFHMKLMAGPTLLLCQPQGGPRSRPRPRHEALSSFAPA